jgi:hypothetical protein
LDTGEFISIVTLLFLRFFSKTLKTSRAFSVFGNALLFASTFRGNCFPSKKLNVSLQWQYEIYKHMEAMGYYNVENVDKQEDFVEFDDIESVDEEEKDYDFGEVPTQSVTVDDIDLSVYADFQFEDGFEEEIVEFKDVENEQEKEFNGVTENIKEENIDFVNEEDEEDEEEFDLFGDGEEKHEQEEKSSLSDDDMVVVIEEEDDNVIIIDEEEDDNVIIIDEEEEEIIIEEKQKKELERLEEEGYLMGMPEEEIEVQEVRKETKPKFDMSGFSQSYGTPKQQFQPNIKNKQNSMNNFGRNTQNKPNR